MAELNNKYGKPVELEKYCSKGGGCGQGYKFKYQDNELFALEYHDHLVLIYADPAQNERATSAASSVNAKTESTALKEREKKQKKAKESL